MDITIKRIAFGDTSSFGVMLDTYGKPFALTGERAWLDNKPGVSCIPSGKYVCKRIHSPHFGETFEVTNVLNRSHILLHKGNIPEKDSQGCILVGEQFGTLNGKLAVLSSKSGYNEFMALQLGHDSFSLTIVDV